jgi:hypothetical protein
MKLILENWNKFLSEDQLDEAPKNTISNKLSQKLNNVDPEQQEAIIIDFFKIIKSGEGYENLFPKWNTQTDEYKAKFIEAGKNFNIGKGRAKEFAQKIVAATTPQEMEASVEAVIDDVEDQTGVDFDDPNTGEAPEEQPIEIKPLLDKFYNFLTKTGVLRESIGSLIKALGAKDTKLVGSSLSKNFKREEIKTLVKYLEDKESVLSFVNQYFANDPEKEQILQRLDGKGEEPSAEGETKVEVGGEEYTYTDEDIQILKKAYEAFASDSEGLMKAKTLRAQEKLWIGLRDALNNIGKFRAIAGHELAMNEGNLFEQENSPQIKRLVVDLERLRKDFNDTDDTLAEYIKKAKGGEYQAKAYMARFLAELKDVQNSIAKAAADTQSMLNIEVNEVISEQDEEEESREQKIENVRNVYMKIEDLLGGILPELNRNVAAQNKEVSVNVKKSYEELQKIRKYFRNVGAFAKSSDKDVGELKEDYLIAKKDIMTSMSRVIDDLRRNRLTPQVATPFLQRLAEVGSFIQANFGVGPNEGFNFKSIDVSADDTSKEEIEADTNAEGPSAVNDIADDFDPEQANDEIEATAGERASVPTEIIDPEFRQKIPIEIQKEISTLKGPISMEEVERLNKLDGGIFIDYYKRYITLIGALNSFIKTGEDNPKKTYENLKALQLLLRMELDEQQINEKSDSSQKSLAQIQKNAIRMTNILKNKPDEEQLNDFEMLYHQILLALDFLVRNPKQIDLKSKHNEFVKTFIPPQSVATQIEPQLQQQNEHKLKKSSSNRTKTLIEKLVREELKVLNGKKMVCN